MKHKDISKLALAAVFWLFSCTSVERDNCLDSGGINYMKCQFSLSSSSVPNSSSSSVQTGIIYGDPVVYDGETYKTVVIGTQTWMARNLNYNGSGKCYPNADCDAYGRLYKWAAAMALPSSCNSSTCEADLKHKGICPDDWHIPSDAEWATLTRFVGQSAGTKLKANSSWWWTNTGTDIYGFAALPGGQGMIDERGDNLSNVARSGSWWSATESGTDKAYYRSMNYDSEVVGEGRENKSYSLSVRCVKD